MQQLKLDPIGDSSLLTRAEQICQGYGCSRSADTFYIALAEQLAHQGTTELITFDVDQSKMAAAFAPIVSVRLLSM